MERRSVSHENVQIDILTLFPAMGEGLLNESMLRIAREKGLASIRLRNLRDWAPGKHRVTDEPPYGGGAGMVLKVEPVALALEELRQPASRVILLSAQGRRFDQAAARRLAGEKHLIMISGHYEGIDQRVADHLVDEEISLGDYILTNGTLPALVVADAVVRLLPGVLGDEQSAADESFSHGLLEYPHYTRPAEFRGWKVPDILLSGNHAAIEAWRREQARDRTRDRRPDLGSGSGAASPAPRPPTG
ncbi:MAG: tRNA (guanosine(37)-N1)-methyltransferase TrmD [Verrucomicrobia bacterium]|jgi:tRNA (guanine37-N1)-methyltransferase|nr:tRNA (guanosine(37)-N1)-methyltransferase TrmD [Verrucomicrobiota bacterium]MDA1204467.1 tRNA (guanosine(37)-N1)-methyltransferase TrmD [Verrucomicrobiota bacterium]